MEESVLTFTSGLRIDECICGLLIEIVQYMVDSSYAIKRVCYLLPSSVTKSTIVANRIIIRELHSHPLTTGIELPFSVNVSTFHYHHKCS